MCKIGCKSKSRHLRAGLASGEDRIGLFFSPTEEKTPGSDLGTLYSMFTRILIQLTFWSASQGLWNLFHVYLHHITPNSALLFIISSSGHALNIFPNSKVLSGCQTSGSDSFTICIFSYTQQTCMKHLLCAGLVALDKVVSKIGKRACLWRASGPARESRHCAPNSCFILVVINPVHEKHSEEWQRIISISLSIWGAGADLSEEAKP